MGHGCKLLPAASTVKLKLLVVRALCSLRLLWKKKRTIRNYMFRFFLLGPFAVWLPFCVLALV